MTTTGSKALALAALLASSPAAEAFSPAHHVPKSAASRTPSALRASRGDGDRIAGAGAAFLAGLGVAARMAFAEPNAAAAVAATLPVDSTTTVIQQQSSSSLERSLPTFTSSQLISAGAPSFGGGGSFDTLDFSLPSYDQATKGGDIAPSKGPPAFDLKLPEINIGGGDSKDTEEATSAEKVAAAEADKAAAEAERKAAAEARKAEQRAAADKAREEEAARKAAEKEAREKAKEEEKARRQAEKEAAEQEKAEKKAAEEKAKADEEAAKAEKAARKAAEREKQRLAVERMREKEAEEAAKEEPAAPAPAPKPAPAPAPAPAPKEESGAPAFSVPEFSAPDIKVPSFSVPKFEAPKFDLPKVDLPAPPKVDIPAPPKPSFTPLPDVAPPKFDIPTKSTYSLDVAPSSPAAVDEDIEPQEVRDERAREAKAVFKGLDADAREIEKQAAAARAKANAAKKDFKAAKDEACKTRPGGKILCLRGFGTGF